jgi:hypothetical protein
VANTSRINGFRPTKHPLSGQFFASNWYTVPASDATALYVGDPVKLATGGDATTGTKLQVTRAAAGDAIVGVVIGVGVNRLNLNIDGQVRPASTLQDVLVCDDPKAIFEVEESNGTLTAANIGKNINHAVGTPSATMARSGATIDVATLATTATLTFKMLGFTTRFDNDFTSASAKVLVAVNNHQFNSGTGTAGV